MAEQPRPGAARPAPSGPNPVVRFVKRFWLAIVLVIVVCVFIGQNTDRTRIDLFLVHVSSPLWLVLAVTTLVGLVIGLLSGRRRERAKVAAQAASGVTGADAATPGPAS